MSGNSLHTAGVTDNVADNDTDNTTTELRKLTADGETLWERTMPNPGYDEFVSLAVSSKGNVYVVTGVAETTRVYYDGTIATTKFDGKGSLLWDETRVLEPYWGLSEIAVDAEDRRYIIGAADTEKELLNSGYVIRYSPGGTRDRFFSLKATGQRAVLDSAAYPLGISVTITEDSYGSPQTRLYIAGYSVKVTDSPTRPNDAFLLSADDRSDETDYDDTYFDSLEAN